MSWYSKALTIFYAVVIAVAVCSRPDYQITDEIPHLRQILSMSEGNLNSLRFTAMLPGYHFIMAKMLGPLDLLDLKALRAVNLFINIISIFLFYRILNFKKENQTHAYIKTLQLAFLPFFIVYSTLAYTESMAMLGVISFLYFYTQGKKLPAILSMVIAFISRHNYLIYILSIMAFSWKSKKLVKKDLIFIISMLIMTAVYVYKSGLNITTGTYTQIYYPFIFPDFGNINYFFFMFFFIFLPINLKTLSKIHLDYKKTIALVLFILVILMAQMFMTRTLNPFNWVATEMNMRNAVLVKVHTDFISTVLYSAITTFGIISLYGHIRDNRDRIILTSTILLLGASWIISARYYLPIFMLFILFRKSFYEEDAERLNLLYSAGMALAFLTSTHSVGFLTM